MKKLLVLTLVLGIASLASAALQLQVDGELVGDEITINISDTITIGLLAGAENVDAFIRAVEKYGKYPLRSIDSKKRAR